MAETSTLILIIILELGIIYFLYQKNKQLRFQKKSIVVKTGKWVEDLFPFLEDFPGNPENFKFIGEPIDGLLFDTETGVHFMEFKTSSSQLSEKQKRIKEQVQKGRVFWHEIRR